MCHGWGDILTGPLTSGVIQVVHVVHARLRLHELFDVDLIESAMSLMGPLKKMRISLFRVLSQKHVV